MSLMPISDDQPGQKTCLKVYNLAGFSIEFAMVRSSTAWGWCSMKAMKTSIQVIS